MRAERSWIGAGVIVLGGFVLGACATGVAPVGPGNGDGGSGGSSFAGPASSSGSTTSGLAGPSGSSTSGAGGGAGGAGTTSSGMGGTAATASSTTSAASSASAASSSAASSTGSPVMGLELQYLCGDTAAMSTQLSPQFQIINNSATAVPLSSLTIHYFYTKDGSAGADQNFACDYAAAGGTTITGSVAAVFDTCTGTNADEYVEVQFAAGAGSLGAGASAQVQTRVWANNYPTFTQTNDYSFDPTKTSYTDWTQVTLYQNGTLVWGTEP